MEEDKKKKDIKREFAITSWAVENRTTVFFLTFIILVLGIVSYRQMPKEAFPEVTFPTIYVGTPYPGNSPSDIENLITRPLEKEIGNISNIKKMTSNSIQDMSTILVEFETDVEPDVALREVKDAVDQAKQELPSDLDQDPIVDDVNVGEFPIMFINLSGDYTPEQLKEYAEVLEDDLEDISEISEVYIRGIEEKEVKVDIDVHKMASMSLSFNDVVNSISARNMTISAGNIKSDGLVQSLKVDSEVDDVDELNDLVIKHEKGNIVFLKDILAKPVRLETKEMESFATFKQSPVVKLDVIKGSGENLISASDKINKLIEKVNSDSYTGKIPQDLEFTITIDQSDMTREQVNNLENSIYSGVILVIIVLLFFLGTRNSLFVGIAIPMSMLTSFVILSGLGVTINMMVLFGLIMALGMLVDNGIVVVENIFRLMDEGYTAKDAAKEGVGEVAWPIITSTATTLAAFLPLALWPGIMGEFMKFLPLTLIVVLTSSLFVALVINPAFTSMFMRVESKAVTSKKKIVIIASVVIAVGVIIVIAGLTSLGNIIALFGIITFLNIYALTPAADWFQKNGLPWLEERYRATVRTTLKSPVLVLVGTFGLLFLSIFIFATFQPKVEFFPDNEPKYINIFVEKPLGTDIHETKEFTVELEKFIRGVVEEEMSAIKAISSQVGKGTSDPGDPMATGADVSTPHKARINIEFEQFVDRGDIMSSDVLKQIQDTLTTMSFPGVTISAEKDRAGPPVGKPINIEVTGEDYDVLIPQTDSLIALINSRNIAGIEELKTDLERGKPEVRLDVDYQKAGRLGVSAYDIANTLRNALYGVDASTFKQGEDEYDIFVRLSKEYRNDLSTLTNQMVTFRDQSTGRIKQIPINALATPVYDPAFASIKRKDQQRVVTIYSNVIDGYNATEINNELKDLLSDYQMPEGYSFKFTGEQEEQAKEMEFLQTALAIAVFLILLIMVAQFNRISAPIIILSSVLLSTTGVFLGLVIFQQPFIVIMTMIGIISLAGIVVNNAIVLLDYTDLTIQRHMANMEDDEEFTKEDLKQSIIESGRTRLRPVLLTAITTVLGLIPLASGLNIDFYTLFSEYDPNIWFGGDNVIFWRPMSLAIIYGVTFATFLTLIVVPNMYYINELIKKYFGLSKYFKKN